MENNTQQQLSAVSKTKKKSKNKKQLVPPVNTAATTATTKPSAIETTVTVTANGLSEKLDHLHLNTSGNGLDLPQVNGNVEHSKLNGHDHNHLHHHHEEVQHQTPNHTPAADKINGDCMAAAAAALITDGNIKSKCKSNKIKNKELKNCHTTNAHEKNCMLQSKNDKHKHNKHHDHDDDEHDNNTTIIVPLQSTENKKLENGFYNHNTSEMQSEDETLLPAKSKESLNYFGISEPMEIVIQNHDETATKTIVDCVKTEVEVVTTTNHSNTAKQSIAIAAAEQNESYLQDSASPTKTTSSPSTTATDLESSLSPTLDLSNVHIEYKEYESELQMHDIMRLIQAELSEPYSIYTYRYFIYNWPKLCFLAAHGNEYVGAIVCKLDMHMNVRRGYIAMLAVRKEYRKLKIGTTLVQKAIEAMLADNADEVVLETEMRNLPALRLYENLGFVRDKRLFRYYLNGVDALRLKLWFR